MIERRREKKDARRAPELHRARQAQRAPTHPVVIAACSPPTQDLRPRLGHYLLILGAHQLSDEGLRRVLSSILCSSDAILVACTILRLHIHGQCILPQQLATPTNSDQVF